MNVTSKKVYYLMLGILVLTLVAALGLTVYGTGTLKKVGDTLLERKLEEAALDMDQQALEKAKKDVESYKELEQVAKAIVPQEKDQARTVREIVSIANKAGIRLQSITFPSSTLGEGQKGKKKSAAPPSNVTQLTPVEGLSGVYAMPITIVTNTDDPVTFTQVLSFLRQLERNRRTSHITSLTIDPNADNRNLVSAQLQINAYIKP
jgi:hypothetical protein